MATALKLEDLSRKSLELLVQLKYAIREQDEEDAIARLVETSIMLEGKKRKGKSLSAVMISYQLRERFGRHVITVGTKLGMTEKFGPHAEITELQFKEALSKIQDVVEEQQSQAAEDVWKALQTKGVDIMYSTIVFDEAGKLFEARNAMSKMVKLFSYFMDQQAHYHCTTILCAPNRKRVDERIRQQVDWYGRVFHNKWTHQCVVRLVSGLETLPLTFNGMDDSEHPSYYTMYHSWALTGYTRSSLNIEHT
jgi:hypothetical protein